jgi:hypothetical protein
VALFGGGIAWGAAVHFADSLPLDAGFLAFVLKVGVGVVFVLAIVLGLLFRGFEVDRTALAAACAIGGAVVGFAVGPTVPPGITVEGSYTFVATMPAGTSSSHGSLECGWANGRWKIGELRTAPLAGLPTPHRLTLDFLRRKMSLADGAGSTLVAIGSGGFETPADAPARGEGDRSGAIDLALLQVDVDSTRDDPNEVRGRFTWDCPGPSG